MSWPLVSAGGPTKPLANSPNILTLSTTTDNPSSFYRSTSTRPVPSSSLLSNSLLVPDSSPPVSFSCPSPPLLPFRVQRVNRVSNPIYISSDSELEIISTHPPKTKEDNAKKPNMVPASVSSLDTTGSRRPSRRVKLQGPIAANPVPVAPAPAGNEQLNGRSLRPRREEKGIYEISSDSSEDAESDKNEYEEEPESENELPNERGTAGRALRPRKVLNAPSGLSDYISTDLALSNRKPTKKSKKKNKAERRRPGRSQSGRACTACRETRRRCDRTRPICSACLKQNKPCIVPEDNSAAEDSEFEYASENPELTVRSEIRRSLEETKKKRDSFYIKYRELFKPLLPERNYISKVVEKRAMEAVASESVDQQLRAEMNDLIEPETTNGGVNTSAPITIDLEVRDLKMEDQQPEHAKYITKVLENTEVVPYKLLENQPENVKAIMKPYQLSGLSYLLWLYKNGASGILGDEMGLGKTLQTLSLFSYLTTDEPCPEGHQRPFLVVCPLSVLSSWIAECKRWTPHLRVLRFHGPTSERARLKKIAETGELFGNDDSAGEGRGYDVVVTSYEVFEREKTWFRRAFVWRYVVLDEGHKIKNDKTNIAIALQGLAAEYRLILTGTPLQNNLSELWALLKWLYPDCFTDNTSKLFSDAFDLTLGKNDLSVMDSARGLLELVMLRRMKESQGVNLGLPKKTELMIFLPLTPMQRFWYKRLLTRLDKGLLEGVFQNSKDKVMETNKENGSGHEFVVQDQDLETIAEDQWGETRKFVEQAVEESKTDGKWRKLMNLLMQLRKCCNHPFLLPNAEPDNAHDHSSMIMLASSKMIFLDKLIEELCMKRGKKVLIFSGFTKMLDLCEDFMEMKGGNGSRFKYGRLDGTTPRARRNLSIRLFNNDSTYKVMLISTRAGGLGINLTSASDVVMLESDWNPQADLQAQARAHRIGQTQPVTVYRLVTQGTVEEQMMGRIRKKLYLSAKITESMRDIHTQTSAAGLNGDAEDNLPTLSTGQLMSLVRSGSRAIARPEINAAEMLRWDWETMIKKCRNYQEQLEAEDKANATAAAEEERRWLSEMERVETRVFEGKHHEKSHDSTRNIAQEWSREERRAGMERVVMINGHPVLKETVGNNEWEAVKTFAGRDPRLAQPEKRKKKTIIHQDYCQVCFDGGTLTTCSGCPRVYHINCLPPAFKPRVKTRIGNFYCPQHECSECEQKTANAGGLIFRCRWCEDGFCEDCINWDKIKLLGETLPEFELLEFPSIGQAFWIKCERCIHRHDTDAVARKMCEDMEKEWDDELAKQRELDEQEQSVPELLLDGTTVESSVVATPVEEEAEVVEVDKKAKKKRRRSTLSGTSKRKRTRA